MNPEPIRPNIDEALGAARRGRLRPRAAARRRCGPRRRGRRAGTFLHQLEVTGLLMYYLAEHRGWRDPVVDQRQQHVDGGTARRALRHHDPRDAGRLQVHRPEDDRDRGDDGRRGIGRVRVRHAPARTRRRLRRPAAARPVHARAGGRALAGLARGRALPRAGRAVVLPADRRPCRAGRVRRRRSGGCSSTSLPTPPTELAGRAGRPDRAARHRRRLQVLPRRRVVAAHPGVGHRAARPRLHGGDLAPSCATRCWAPASGWSAGNERRRGRRPRGSTSRGATSSSGRTPTATSARSS